MISHFLFYSFSMPGSVQPEYKKMLLRPTEPHIVHRCYIYTGVFLCHFLRWLNQLPVRGREQQTASEYLFCSNLFSCSICLREEALDATCAERLLLSPELWDYCLWGFLWDDCIGSGSEDTSGLRNADERLENFLLFVCLSRTLLCRCPLSLSRLLILIHLQV